MDYLFDAQLMVDVSDASRRRTRRRRDGSYRNDVDVVVGAEAIPDADASDSTYDGSCWA